MTDLIDAVRAGASGDELARCQLPAAYRAAYLRADDMGMFGDVADKDVRRSIHLGEVPMPELAPDEALIAVMASAINYNTVWSAMFEPVPTFSFLARYGRRGHWAARHDQPYHVPGSDAAGVVVRVGAGVQRWSPGDRVVVAPAYIDAEDPAAQNDGMTTGEPLAWGYETNFGSLAEFAVVKASQLLPKPPHLTWEEAACSMLCAATSYRMLVSPRGAVMKQGDIVLIWGATGGLGCYAVQLVRNGGGIAVGVVSSPERAELARELGCAAVINREALGTGGLGDAKGWRRLGEEIRRQVGEDPHIVFEHSGRETFGASVYVARRGGTVVTCGSSSGYQHEYDNRHLWMKLKRIVGSHGANYAESWEVSRLIMLGMLVPALSSVYPLDETGEATRAVQQGRNAGKTSVLCLAQQEGLGISDAQARQRVGEARLRLFRDGVLWSRPALGSRPGRPGPGARPWPSSCRAHRAICRSMRVLGSCSASPNSSTIWRSRYLTVCG
jgi:crotonyl-CoA reductase